MKRKQWRAHSKCTTTTEASLGHLWGCLECWAWLCLSIGFFFLDAMFCVPEHTWGLRLFLSPSSDGFTFSRM